MTDTHITDTYKVWLVVERHSMNGDTEDLCNSGEAEPVPIGVFKTLWEATHYMEAHGINLAPGELYDPTKG